MPVLGHQLRFPLRPAPEYQGVASARNLLFDSNVFMDCTCPVFHPVEAAGAQSILGRLGRGYKERKRTMIRLETQRAVSYEYIYVASSRKPKCRRQAAAREMWIWDPVRERVSLTS
jgi:hypothetical protein